ncbi:GDSL-type esterase/lipase family protein [uncultured Gilvimarinus sp.]|uniref:GDSL-type esterase/lipase family protein n=1 Tax=uncultured Gilvimarinus sp. TaxID=1689143 RepID=UPI0030EE66B3|tara:strand:+ start:2100 stop:3362 length:1263 start_codon:yes stop_codon:yes gene_type:complete
MLKVLIMSAAALTLTACSSVTHNNQSDAVALLADDVSLTVFNHDEREPLSSGSLTLGNAERAIHIKRVSGGIEASWHDSWWTGFEVAFPAPKNLTHYRQGAYVFDLHLEQFENAGFDFARLCEGGCERRLSLANQVQPLLNQGPQTVAVPMSCLVRDSDTLVAERTPLRFATGGTGQLTLSDMRIEARMPQVDIVFNCPDYKTASVTPAPLDEHWAKSWWIPRHEQKLKIASESDPQLVFIGDSITQGWEESGKPVYQQAFAEWPSLNLGFSGDRTENVLWRLQHGEVADIDPQLIVLMIGTNNTGHRQDEPVAIARGVEQILTELKRRLPDSKILMLAIFPRGATADDYARRNNTLANARLRNFADGEQVFFTDLNSVFLGKDGNLSEEIMPDLLHPNEYGYQLWANELVPLIREHIDR